MASIISGFFKRVIKIRVEGNLNENLTQKIMLGLQKSRFYRPEAILVVINSTGGSLPQAKHISDIIQSYGAKNNAPVYCFAEDHCLGSANVILTCGVKCYANEFSVMGDFSFEWSKIWFKKFVEKYNVKIDMVYSGENKIKFNAFEDIKPASEKWMQDHLYLLEHDLKCTIVNNRQKHFNFLNMDKHIIEEKVFKGPIIPPEKAASVGLIDGIKNIDEVLSSSFEGVSIYEVNKKRRGEFIEKGLELVHEFK